MQRCVLAAMTFLSLAAACGDDGTAIDAGADDAAIDARDDSPDAFDPCPDQATFEAEITDLSTGAAPGLTVEVTEVGTANATTSAPNGRAVLCLEPGGSVRISFVAEGYATRVLALDADAAARQFATLVPYPVEIAESDTLDELADDLGVVRDPDDAVVWIDARRDADSTGLVGTSATLDVASDGPYVRDGSGSFVSGAETTEDGVLLFFNVDPGADSTTLSLDPPEGAGSCSGPTILELGAGAIASVLHRCQ